MRLAVAGWAGGYMMLGATQVEAGAPSVVASTDRACSPPGIPQEAAHPAAGCLAVIRRAAGKGGSGRSGEALGVRSLLRRSSRFAESSMALGVLLEYIPLIAGVHIETVESLGLIWSPRRSEVNLWLQRGFG